MIEKRVVCFLYSIGQDAPYSVDRAKSGIIVRVIATVDADGLYTINRRQLLRSAKEFKCTEYCVRSFGILFAPTKHGSFYDLRTGIRPLSE